MPRSVFRLFTIPQFSSYLQQTNFHRRVSVIQNHHTFRPDYSQFNRNPQAHMSLMESMRKDHIERRGWSDIGQNITVFPDGIIGLCRSLDVTPAGIFGANTGAICLEHVGDFDSGHDNMTQLHKDTIVATNALLCLKFGLQPIPQHVVYHHWFDRKGKRFSDNDINSGRVLAGDLQKTCPGTAFFATAGASQKGNTVASAMANFFPLIAAELGRLQAQPVTAVQPVLKRVSASLLNVRSGPGVQFPIMRQLFSGIQVQVFAVDGKWSRINASVEEWVHSDFLS